MAVAIEGATVVVRLDRIEDLVEGGLETLNRLAPNGMALADKHLWRCPFMIDNEATAFLGRLVELGLNSQPGPDPDAVVVNEFDLEIVPYCEWLKIERIQKGVIAWLEGTTPTTVTARAGWSFESGSGLERRAEDDPNLEFVQRDEGVETYIDKRTQKKVYVARKTPSIDALNATFKTAGQVIRDHWVQSVDEPVSGPAVEAVREAITDLQQVVDVYPDHWQSLLFIGKGWQALGDRDASYAALSRAFEFSKDNESVPRELAGLCIEMGKGEEAVRIGERAASLLPDNHETLGNLACAYLMAGRLVEAEKTIHAALKLNETDTINRRLSGIISEVKAGKRPQPHKMSDLTSTASSTPQTKSPTKSLWQKLQFWKQ